MFVFHGSNELLPVVQPPSSSSSSTVSISISFPGYKTPKENGRKKNSKLPICLLHFKVTFRRWRAMYFSKFYFFIHYSLNFKWNRYENSEKFALQKCKTFFRIEMVVDLGCATIEWHTYYEWGRERERALVYLPCNSAHPTQNHLFSPSIPNHTFFNHPILPNDPKTKIAHLKPSWDACWLIPSPLPPIHTHQYTIFLYIVLWYFYSCFLLILFPLYFVFIFILCFIRTQTSTFELEKNAKKKTQRKGEKKNQAKI